MSAPGEQLRCAKCGITNQGELALVAKLGGTHYRKTRNCNGVRATTCGTWIDDDSQGPGGEAPMATVGRR